MTTPPTARPAATENLSRTAADDANRVRIVLHGALGRMGQRIAACAAHEPACHIVQALDRDEALAVRRGEAEVVIDFSSDAGAVRAASIATDLGAALLVGTTGLSASTLDQVAAAAERVPTMVAPNTSLGVAVARRLVAEAARLLPGFDVDIVETHHTRKLDAPSGTARHLADAVARGSGKPLDPSRIHAIRAGDVVGDHEVIFSGPGERVTVAHAATSRDLFALGALRMARWLARQKPGMHTADAWFEDFARPGGAPR
ncbi:MAG: 4-hydroxy-tetrahydrodipicolinate reductase [Phycisphaerales bacterium]